MEGKIRLDLDHLGVLIESAQKLKDLISSKQLTFGTTSNGADWCVKALHPSDPITEVRGIPDHSSVPSMFMNYQTVTTVSPSVGATGTWSIDMQLLPHPIGFSAYSKTDSVGTTRTEVMNSQLTGATHVEKFNSFRFNFQRWRLAYASVTIYQDGPDLANQGTVVVCQKPVDPNYFAPTVGNMNGIYTGPVAYCDAFDISGGQLPDYDASQSMPNAYFGRSREGCYVPLKLTQTHQQWHGYHDLVYQVTNGAVQTDPALPNYFQMTLPFSGAAVANGSYPFTTLNSLHYYQSAPDAGNLAGSPTSNFCNQNWADISFRNMAVTTSLSMFFRFGFECQTLPGSQFAPHLKLSPQHDPTAISTYFAISRELKDGYPADFNDLGKIWSAIKDAASAISPVIEMIPGYGSMIVGAGKLAGKIGDKIVGAATRVAEPSIGNTASESDREQVRKVLSNIPIPPPIPPLRVPRQFDRPARQTRRLQAIEDLERRLEARQREILNLTTKSASGLKIQRRKRG